MQQDSSITINYLEYFNYQRYSSIFLSLAFATPLPQCFHKSKKTLIEELQVVDLLLL